DLGFLSAKDALDSSGIDKETLDYIIVAHNFGDVVFGSNRSDLVPSLASRVKYMLGIENPGCVAYDLPFGCPGWVEGLIQANYFIRSGDVKRCLVIGAETLSRVVDPSDRDTMLFSDGSGAVILEALESEAPARKQRGILAHKTRTYAGEHAMLLKMGGSNAPERHGSGNIFLKMNGRKVYEFALSQVPLVIKEALDMAGVHITEIKKVLIHQANDKMDAAILERLFRLYGCENCDAALMPMTISWLGNTSVATIPTLLDLIMKGKFKDQHLSPGDTVIISSVGAGMNVNALIYRF
ncbi:MAG TPA: 3-oxoacyl-[acyl-carrier-protein] synthase III C-terminal domain-containing protein, partial [Anseongella sp.]|nr:3-oxoacyl-[acyl-carrier-protein] synthase III C-terminal domain-containing protein [Anseongella sp.]